MSVGVMRRCRVVGHDYVGVQEIAGAVVWSMVSRRRAALRSTWKSRRRLWVAVVMK
jgi:hypothetical protein